MNDNELLLAIQELLDGQEWTPDTLQDIADLMIKSGYRVRDLDEHPLEPEKTGEPVERWMVVYGDPMHGFTHVGPYDDYDAALHDAEMQAPGGDSWWIGSLIDPDEKE